MVTLYNLHYISTHAQDGRAPRTAHTKIFLNTLLEAANYNIGKITNTVTALPINQIKILTKTVTGHNNMKYHLEKIGYAYDNDCTYCSPKDEIKKDGEIYEEETSSHIICDCIAFSNQRLEIYGKTELKTGDLITGNLKNTIKNITKFMDKTECLKRLPQISKYQLSPPRPKKRRHDNTNKLAERETKQRKILDYLDT